MKVLKLGLIGCGGMMYAHATNVNKVEGIEIVSVCDIIPERAERVARELGNDPKIVTDYKTMVDDIDAVLVALPHDLHYECGLFFARHKKHVLMEKPLCNTEEECESLIRVCEEEGVTLMCAYPVPFYPAMVKLKEFLDSGEYGKTIQMSIWTEQLTKHDEEWFWGATARLGGGQFFSHGCHYVDLLLRFLGNPVEGSHFGSRVGTPWLLKEGTSVAIFKFESGALGYHGATWGARGTKMGYDFQVITEKGTFDYERATGEIRFYSKLDLHDPAVVHPSSHYTVLYTDADVKGKQTNYEISHFVDCVNTGKRPLTDGRSALQGLRVIWRMYEAEKNGVIADLRGLGLDEV